MHSFQFDINLKNRDKSTKSTIIRAKTSNPGCQMEAIWHGARISPCVKMALSMYCGPQPFWNIPYISRTVN